MFNLNFGLKKKKEWYLPLTQLNPVLSQAIWWWVRPAVLECGGALYQVFCPGEAAECAYSWWADTARVLPEYHSVPSGHLPRYSLWKRLLSGITHHTHSHTGNKGGHLYIQMMYAVYKFRKSYNIIFLHQRLLWNQENFILASSLLVITPVNLF